MKKLIAIVLLAVSAMTASAQMMTSRTLMKRENPTTWYVRAGLSINMLSGMSSEDKTDYDGYEQSTGSKAGFEIDFGFNKPMGKSGLYWGMELGIGNRGGKITGKYKEDGYNDECKTSFNSWALNYSPFTLGYKYSVTDNLKLDVHLGAFALVDMSQKAKFEEDGDKEDIDEAFDSRFDAGIQAGLGAWFKKFNLDVTYRHGFVGYVSMPNDPLKSSSLLIRLGYAF